MKKALLFILLTFLLSVTFLTSPSSAGDSAALNITKAAYDSNENLLTLNVSNLDRFKNLGVVIGGEILGSCNGSYEACCDMTLQNAIVCYLDETTIAGGATYSVMVRAGQGDSGIDSMDVFIPPLPPATCQPNDFRACYTGDASEIGVGTCMMGTRSCVNGAWDETCNGEVRSVDETCNGIDDDCDGEIDEDFDADHDGFATCAEAGPVDCDDDNPDINPGATELCNGIDDDCNAATADGAGEDWAESECDGPDSDNCEEGVFECIGGAQICSDNTEDDIELCNGIDDDCNGLVDENLSQATTCGLGECAGHTGTEACEAGAWNDTCDPLAGASNEICDYLDNDCDGLTDEGFLATNDGIPLFQTCSAGTGACYESGFLVCSADGGTECSVTGGQPAEETCNGVDDDCDGEVDEDLQESSILCAYTCQSLGTCYGVRTVTCSGGQLVIGSCQ